MKTYLTQRTFINQEGELIIECGENITAINETWANIKCPKSYEVIGELLMEIPEKDLVPDWGIAIDYENKEQ